MANAAASAGERKIPAGRIAFIALIAGVAALRMWHLCRMMVLTGDIVRHLNYGVMVGEAGWSVAGHPLSAYHGLFWVSWSTVPYNYPVVTLGFFRLLAAIWPSIFFGKLALTLIEAANAWLVARITGRRWLGALYWAAPVSIWWVSREGQFEPLQNLFVLSALYLLNQSIANGCSRLSCNPNSDNPQSAIRNPQFGTLHSAFRICLAFLLLSLAVQVKLTAIFLLPWFIVTVWRSERRRLAPGLLAFAAGALPTLLAMRAYPILNAIGGNLGALHFNPYHWNIFAREWKGDWVPMWLTLVNAAVTWPALLFCAWRLARPATGGRRWEYLAPLLFLVALKTHSNVQFWYVALWPTFVLPVSDRRARLALLLLWPLLDVTSILALLGRPIGTPASPFYQYMNPFAAPPRIPMR